uniref:GG16808 n=1 Tax=Drosophila erecta TaxID=7220 RepID=B3NZB4_DROER
MSAIRIPVEEAVDLMEPHDGRAGNEEEEAKQRNAIGMCGNWAASAATPAALPPSFNGCLATAAAIMDVKGSVLFASLALARANGSAVFHSGHAALLATHLRRRLL